MKGPGGAPARLSQLEPKWLEPKWLRVYGGYLAIANAAV
jgi:hypothetical protein